MPLRPLLLATLVPALLVGGCMGTENRGLESVHQPVVSRADYALDLPVDGGQLAPGEADRLGGWLATMRLGYGDRVALDDPAGVGGGVRDQVAGAIARYGLLLSDDAPVTAAPMAPGVIRVVVSRMHAAVPGCPDWTRNSSVEFESNTSSNFGCAINANLAAMVARPEDLVSGRVADGTTDGAVASRAIDTFRKATPTGAGGTAVKAQGSGGK